MRGRNQPRDVPRHRLRQIDPAHDFKQRFQLAPLHLPPLRAALADRRIAECVLPDGERYKTLETLSTVIDALVAGRCNRDAVILALGGGVVGDIAGFAAACYQRGIAFVQLPPCSRRWIPRSAARRV